MQGAPKWIAILAGAGVVLAALAYVALRTSAPPEGASSAPAEPRPAAAYADTQSCAVCHGEIARTYALTGMGRSFSRLRPDSTLADFKNSNRLHHAASDRHYTMVERDGKFYQRRHQIGRGGGETNAVELEAHFVVGSGNHARTFFNRTSDGRLQQLPVSWYAERGGFWAMSPGYDRAAHLDFRRVVDEGCVSCHNGYPRGVVTDEGNGPVFADLLPDGIDCQRCHGPGQAHIDAVKAGQLETARRVIANPATFDRDRQLETCLQCHLEPTSRPLPFQIRRFERPPFAFVPGQPLGDHVIYFDHAPASGRDDKFEIAGGAYRLRKSACFQQSQMTCRTCHDPHDIPRGASAVKAYVAVCEGCHKGAHADRLPQVRGVGAGATCLDCHMPKRRTEDAVHVVMTDHYIQRQRAAGDLVAPRQESASAEAGDYRGEVVLYYPETLPPTPENELYLSIAQVQQGSNLTAGIPRLEQAIAKHKPGRPEPYYELARAYAKASNDEAAVRWAEESLRRDAGYAPALKELAAAATRMGRLPQASQTLEKAVAVRARDAAAWADLGNMYLQQGRLVDAEKALTRALAIDPMLPRAHNSIGLAALRKGDGAAAERSFRTAITHQPDLAEAQNNLGNLLAARQAYDEAALHFEQAVRSDPTYVDARHSYGLVLALTKSYPRAVAELEAAVQLAPGRAQVRTDLADVLSAIGRTEAAAGEYALAIQADPAAFDAHLALGEILVRQKRYREARHHFEAVSQSSDPEIRNAGLTALASLDRQAK